MGPGGGRRMKPDQISSLDSGVGAAASAGRSRGGCPGRNAGRGCAPRLYRRRQWAREALVQPCPAWVTKPPRPLLGDVRVGVPAGGAAGPPPPLRPPPPPLLSLEGGRMYGAAGPPARSASAPLVRSLRRPPPPTTGSVEKGLRARSSPWAGVDYPSLGWRPGKG